MKGKIVLSVVATSVVLGMLYSSSVFAEEEVTLQSIFNMLLGIDKRLENIEDRVEQLEVKRERTVTSTSLQEVFNDSTIDIEIDEPEESYTIYDPTILRDTFDELLKTEVSVNPDKEVYQSGEMMTIKGKANSQMIYLHLQQGGVEWIHVIFLHKDGTFSVIIGTDNLHPGEWNIKVIDKDIVVNKRITIIGQ